MELAYRRRPLPGSRRRPANCRRPLPGNTTPEVKLEWALFNRCVIVGQSAPSSMVAVAQSSNDLDVRVSLRLATPPSISYVQLNTEDCVYNGPPMVVAADGDLLLIHMVVPVDGAPSFNFPDNFFVYKADPEWPWLKRVPSVGDWMGDACHTGILNRGGKEFVVADLQVRVVSLAPDAHEVAELMLYSSDCSSGNMWELKRLDMPYDRDKNLYPLCWETDAVFSYDGFMCWADYHRGVLFCDILAKEPVLCFVQFPGIDDWKDFSNGRGLPGMYRSVSVSEGKVCFVDIDNGRFREKGRSSCVITTWTLEKPELVWVKGHTVELTTLWSHWRYSQSPMPRCVPRFPVIDMNDGGIVHFILSDRAESTEHWMLTVDMRHGYLRSYTTYKNAIEDPEADFDVKNMFWDIPLLSSGLCKCLNLTSGGSLDRYEQGVGEDRQNAKKLVHTDQDARSPSGGGVCKNAGEKGFISASDPMEDEGRGDFIIMIGTIGCSVFGLRSCDNEFPGEPFAENIGSRNWLRNEYFEREINLPKSSSDELAEVTMGKKITADEMGVA